MSKVNASKRAKWLGMGEHDPAAAKQVMMDYLKNIAAKDDRRLMWVAERAASAVAVELDELEADLTRHLALERPDEVKKCQERIALLTEDFRLLWAVQMIFREQGFANFAEEFRQSRKKK